MARLEIEIGAKAEGAKKELSEVSERLKGLKDEYSVLNSKLTENNRSIDSLKGSLIDLNKQYRSGAISQSEFNKRSDAFGLEISKLSGKTQDYQSRLNSLDYTIKQVQKSTDALDGSSRKLRTHHQDFSNGVDAHSVSLSRQVFAQRAALSSANNLTRAFTALTSGSNGAAAAFGVFGRQLALLATSSAQSGISLKSLVSAFTGAGGITIAISVAVTAITGYIASMKKVKKETDDNAKSQKQYADTLEAVRGALLKGSENAQVESARLNVLYKVTQDATKSTAERLSAVKKLQKEYPAYFANLTNEAILNGKAETSYLKLKAAILATAQARAIEQKIADKASEQLNINEKNIDAVTKLNREQAKLNKEIERLGGQQRVDILITESLGAGGGSLAALGQLNKYLTIQESIRDLGLEINKGAKSNKDLDKQINDLLAMGVGLYGEQVIEVEKVKKGVDKVKEAEKKRLERLKKLLDDIRKKANGVTLSPFEKSIRNSLTDLQQIRSELFKINNKDIFDPFDLSKIKNPVKLKGMTAEEQASLSWQAQKAQLDAQIKQANEATGELSKRIQNQIGRTFVNTIDNIVNSIGEIGAKNYEIEQKYIDLRKGATQDQIRDLQRLERLEKRLNTGFETLFNNAFNQISNGINSIFKSMLTESIGEKISSKDFNFAGLSNDISKALVAGAGLAGNLLSGVLRPTSTGGQAIGGALGGAASGMAFGLLGAGVGAIVGAISGIFGSSAAKKRERLMEQQLEQQKKQTALAQRQAALAYSSSIIGQMTNQGIVTNIDRNSFGDITFRIEGRDLVASLNRETDAQKRGI